MDVISYKKAKRAEELAQEIIDGQIDVGVLQTKINEKLGALETQYSPRLSAAETSLATSATQLSVTVYASDYNLTGDGTTDDSVKISNAINKALTNIPTDNAHLVVEVKLPAGKFAILNPIVVDGTQVTTSSVFQILLKVTGATEGGTIIVLQNNTALFNLNNIAVRFQDIKFSGYNYTGSAFILGSATQFQAVSGSEFKNCRFYGFNNIFKVNLMWDSSFIDCGFFAMAGTNPTVFNIINHPIDNTNNLNFFRCHFENMPSGTFFKALGTLSGSGFHHDINFYGCHFETRSFNTNILDVRYCRNINFHGGQFTMSNLSTYGYTFANFIPAFKIQDSNLIFFKGAMILVQLGTDTSTPLNKIFEVGGSVTGLSIENSFIQNMFLTGNPSINALIQQTSGNALVDASMQSFKFKNVFINDTNLVPYNDYRLYMSDPDARHYNAQIKNNSTSGEIEFLFSTDPQAQDNSFTKVFGVGRQTGVVNGKVYTGEFCGAVNNGTTSTISINNTINANRRGIYLIYADAPGAAYAIVHSDGTALTGLMVGGAMAVGTANPNIAGKFNIYLSGTSIAINNQFGSDRKVSVVPFGFR
jgi:hypothetical protein